MISHTKSVARGRVMVVAPMVKKTAWCIWTWYFLTRLRSAMAMRRRRDATTPAVQHIGRILSLESGNLSFANLTCAQKTSKFMQNKARERDYVDWRGTVVSILRVVVSKVPSLSLRDQDTRQPKAGQRRFAVQDNGGLTGLFITHFVNTSMNNYFPVSVSSP